MASKRTERAEEEHVHVGEVLERRVGALYRRADDARRAAGDIAQTRTVLRCCRHRRHLRHHRRRGGRIGHVARFRRFGGFGVGRAGVRAPPGIRVGALLAGREGELLAGEEVRDGCGHGGLELVHGGGGGAGIVRGEEVRRLGRAALHGEDVFLKRLERASQIVRGLARGAGVALGGERELHARAVRLERVEERADVLARVGRGVHLGTARLSVRAARLLDGVQSFLEGVGNRGRGGSSVSGAVSGQIRSNGQRDARRDLADRTSERAHHHLSALRLHLRIVRRRIVAHGHLLVTHRDPRRGVARGEMTDRDGREQSTRCVSILLRDL